MAGLGESHRRRILVTFQHVDKLLGQILHSIARASSDLQPRVVQDLSPSKIVQIQNHIELIRDRMSILLKRFEIGLPERSKPLSWVLKTNLTSIGIALDDLSPSKIRGYGDLDADAARELRLTLQEIHNLVNHLHRILE